jgi:hypothetical protein
MTARWQPGDAWRSPVAVARKSSNAKTGPVATTSVSQATCPDGTRGTVRCPFLEAGCYAETVGMQPWTTRRLNSNTTGRQTEIARIEARAIDALPADRKLRVHVVGDCRTSAASAIVGAAMVRYEARGGFPAWTYTHAWATVPRSAWNGARVFASVHTHADVTVARANGYTGLAIAGTARHPGRKVYRVLDVDAVPCPAQQFDDGRGRVQCETCTICQEPDKMADRGLAVVFQPDQLKKGTIAQ